MPLTIVSTGASFPASIAAPSSTDVRNAASVQPGFQGCFDAAKFLERALNTCLVPADLIAIAAPANLLKRFLPGQGWYTFTLGSAAATNDPTAYRATDATGTWFSDTNSYGTSTATKQYQQLSIVGKKTPGDVTTGTAWIADQRIVTNAGLATGEYFDIALDIPNGATLASVDVRTLGISGASNPSTKATYVLYRIHNDTVLTALTAAPVADAHTYAGGAGSWLVTIATTNVPAVANTVIDRKLNRYVLRVLASFDVGVTSAMAVYESTANFTYGPWVP